MTLFPGLFRGAVEDLRVRPRGNVPTLDVLRSIAILVVVTAHFAGEFEGVHWVQVFPAVYWGWTGVDLFFVLSGFLIGTQLWKEVSRTNRIRIGRFLLRRGLRIWPLYYSFVLVAAVRYLLGRRQTGIWPDVFFLSNYFSGQIAGGWSLSTEEQFYILAPVSIALALLLFRPKRLWILPVGGLLLLMMNRGISIHRSVLAVADLRQKLYFPIATHADGLAIGLLIAWVGVFYPWFLKSRLSRLAAGAMVALGVGLYAVNQVLFNFLSLALIFGAAALWGISLEKTPKLLDLKIFYVISRLSYGMYLNHFAVLVIMRSYLLEVRRWGGEPMFWVLYLACVLASMAVAFVTFQLVEWPFLQLRTRWLSPHKEKTKAESQPASETAMA